MYHPTVCLSLLTALPVLDPRYKLHYFSENGWLDSWIDDAQFAIERAFNEDWKGRATSESGKGKEVRESDVQSYSLCGPLTTLQPAAKVTSTAQDSAVVTVTPKNIFDAARDKRRKAAAPMTDELEHYLAAEPDPTITNALAWWCSPERRQMYPQLLRMARCYLTIPRECSLLLEQGSLLTVSLT